MQLKAIVALRNPGQSYEKTRHNVGSWLLNELLLSESLVFKKHKSFAVEYTNLNTGVFCMQSTDYMNNSGAGVAALVRYYKLQIPEILVIHDDLDLTPGLLKLKFSGGDGGHNGLKSLISHLQSNDFWRLRIGIGRPCQQDVSSFVLGCPSPDDLTMIRQSISLAKQYFGHLLSGDEQAFMRNVHNRGAV